MVGPVTAVFVGPILSAKESMTASSNAGADTFQLTVNREILKKSYGC